MSVTHSPRGEVSMKQLNIRGRSQWTVVVGAHA